MKLHAVSICAGLRGRLPGPGAVHGVFGGAFSWICRDGELITVLDRSRGNIPGGILVDLPKGAGLDSAVKAGEPVAASPEEVRLARLTINLRRAPEWTPRPPGSGLGAGLRAERVATDENDPFERRMAEVLPQLKKALRARDAAVTEDAAGRLIGLGSGLTPAGDDVLTGVIAVFRMAGTDPWFDRPAGQIADRAQGKTTVTSAAMLRHAARGELPERLADYIAAKSETGLVRTRSLLQAVGHSSGRDMMRGVALALDVINER